MQHIGKENFFFAVLKKIKEDHFGDMNQLYLMLHEASDFHSQDPREQQSGADGRSFQG